MYNQAVLKSPKRLADGVYRTIERWGRRATMLYSAMASTVLFIIFIALNAVGCTGQLWAAVVVMFFIVFVQTFGWQANKFLYSSEIAPLEYRHIGGAFFASGEWLMVFITVLAGPIGLSNCGWPFWFFILSGNIVGVVFVYLLCPETAGRTLEQGQSLSPAYTLPTRKLIELVDYLFVDKGLAGLRRNSVSDVEDVERKLSAAHVEHIRKLSMSSNTAHEVVATSEK